MNITQEVQGLKGRAKTWLKVYLQTHALEQELEYSSYSHAKKLQAKIDNLHKVNEARAELLTQEEKDAISDHYGVAMFDY